MKVCVVPECVAYELVSSTIIFLGNSDSEHKAAVSSAESPVPIKGGEIYTIPDPNPPAAWPGITTNPDQDTPQNAFEFVVATTANSFAASAILFCYASVNNPLSTSTTYISATTPLPAGTYPMFPKEMVRVWWQTNGKASHLVGDPVSGGFFVVDLDGVAQKDIFYNEDGTWSNSSDSV